MSSSKHRKSQKAPQQQRDFAYRPCVGVMLLNREGLVFVGRRKSEAGPEHVGNGYAWQMPQGGIDPGEGPFDAALRELHEETNVSSATLLAEAPEWYSYDLPSMIAGRAWKGRYRGQIQRWFAFRFDGPDQEIDIARPAGGRHRPEFDEWRWERMERLPELIIPFKRAVYEKVVAAFAHLAPSVKETTAASQRAEAAPPHAPVSGGPHGSDSDRG